MFLARRAVTELEFVIAKRLRRRFHTPLLKRIKTAGLVEHPAGFGIS
jgi:hypothetical protein